MKKLFLIHILFLTAVLAWSMPPKPGSGHTHDGSLDGMDFLEFNESVSSDNLTKAPPRMRNTAKMTGERTILVLLVDFPANGDVGELGFNKQESQTWEWGCKYGSKTHGVSYYEELLETGSGLTMTKFYKDMSNNQLSLKFKVLGPYRAKNDYVYYGKNDSSGKENQKINLIGDILDTYKGDIESEISGCTIDPCCVIFIHAGPGEEDAEVPSDFIWSCTITFPSTHRTIGGVAFDRYTIQPEYIIDRNTTEAGIGVFCHEFGHILGLPDLYDTGIASDSTKTAGVGNWSLMGSGSWGSRATGTDPVPLMNWEKATLGWLPERVITPSARPKKIEFKNADGATELLRINLDTETRQYLVFDGKKKQNDGTGKYVMEDGLLITQIHEGVYRNKMSANKVNAGSSVVHAVSIVEAKADNYVPDGLGNLWRDCIGNRKTTTACFRSDTATSFGPVINGKIVIARHPLAVIMFKTMLASAVLVGVIAAIYMGRKKLCFVLVGAVAMIFFCLACDTDTEGGSGAEPVVVDYYGPDTNYYKNTSDVHSKTGISGIKIYDIQCNSDGSGSFLVVKED